ncbi:MAG: thioredoxin family protein [Pseudomonadota bacterium]
MLKYILLISLLFSVSACSPDEQPGKSSSSLETGAQNISSVSAPVPTQQAADFKLMFFLNPDGGPCILQNNILQEMAGDLSGKVDIQYVQTTVAADLNIFNQYGIRALPALILADAGGKEINRMPPGVKRADDIRLLIQSIPQS